MQDKEEKINNNENVVLDESVLKGCQIVKLKVLAKKLI